MGKELTKGLENIRDILVGTFDNSKQVEEERKQGHQIHPLAKHVTAEFTDRVINKPSDFTGIYILEESYYTYPGKEMEVKPLFFHFLAEGSFDVKLYSLVIPEKYDKHTVINANKELSFDYNELKANEWFNPALYKWNDAGFFTTNNPSTLPNGAMFTLIETLRLNCLEVMERYEKDGILITPYNTPILYDRIG